MKNLFKSKYHFLIPFKWFFYNYFSKIVVMKPKQNGELILKDEKLWEFLELEADIYNMGKK